MGTLPRIVDTDALSGFVVVDREGNPVEGIGSERIVRLQPGFTILYEGIRYAVKTTLPHGRVLIERLDTPSWL